MKTSLQNICLLKGMALINLSQLSGIKIDKLQEIFLNHYTPSVKQREVIAQALDVSVEDITWGHSMDVEHLYGPI